MAMLKRKKERGERRIRIALHLLLKTALRAKEKQFWTSNKADASSEEMEMASYSAHFFSRPHGWSFLTKPGNDFSP